MPAAWPYFNVICIQGLLLPAASWHEDSMEEESRGSCWRTYNVSVLPTLTLVSSEILIVGSVILLSLNFLTYKVSRTTYCLLKTILRKITSFTFSVAVKIIAGWQLGLSVYCLSIPLSRTGFVNNTITLDFQHFSLQYINITLDYSLNNVYHLQRNITDKRPGRLQIYMICEYSFIGKYTEEAKPWWKKCSENME